MFRIRTGIRTKSDPQSVLNRFGFEFKYPNRAASFCFFSLNIFLTNNLDITEALARGIEPLKASPAIQYRHFNLEKNFYFV
jgi:hypothetical protein